MAKKFFPILLVVIFSIIAGFSLIHRGLPPTHDGEYHIIRFYEFDKALKDGNWYPRWAPDLNNGYGVPLFNYVYPLPNYIASFSHIFGISFIDAFKLEMFFAFIIGGIFFYLWSKEFWGTLGGIVSSIFYSFSPYHFVDVYIRGSVGEVWALAFFPAFLWSITKFFRERRNKYIAISSIFLALIIFSHNILALMFFAFSTSYIILLIGINKNRKYLILNTFYIILIGLGLSSIFWIPAIFEKQYVIGLEIFNLNTNFPDLYQLIFPSWGSGFFGTNMATEMSIQIGVANIFAVFISLYVGYMFFRKKKIEYRIIFFFIISFIILLFLMQKISYPIWANIPLVNYFQFPWRLLSLVILIASFLAGSIVFYWKSWVLTIIMIAFTFLLGIEYAKPAYYHYRDDSYYITRSNFIDGTNSPGNAFNTIFFNENLKKQTNKAFFLKGDGVITSKKITSSFYNFNIETKYESEIGINTAYFPGWSVFVDSKKVKVNVTPNGLFSFKLNSGNHDVKIEFGSTSPRTIGTISSLVFILLSLFFLTKDFFARNK
ncbi:MAG: 6-pyruvoyl-tetrahydropterin synthase-related protein [Candidatus Levybacteria bacterium]|nr:6-pyruvoyl-tetrahydropterin synthase-related protein [Candidatus Levybacteria bacterium]